MRFLQQTPQKQKIETRKMYIMDTFSKSKHIKSSFQKETLYRLLSKIGKNSL